MVHHDSLFRATHLAINILSTDQLDVVGVATKADDKFAGLDLGPGPFGSPLIARSSAQMEVEIRERLQTSTHTLFVCRVLHTTVSDRHPNISSAVNSSTAPPSPHWVDQRFWVAKTIRPGVRFRAGSSRRSAVASSPVRFRRG